MNRGRVGGMLPAGSVYPTSVGGGSLLLWLRADQGVTQSNASVANPNDFGTGWAPARAAVATNTAETTDPLGTNLADKLTEDATVGATHLIGEAPTNFQTGPGLLTVSMKNGVTNGRRYMFIGPTVSDGTMFDLQAGIVFANVGTGVGRIASLGNGWYDCTTQTAVAMATYQLFMSTDGTTTSYNGDNASNVYLFNARLTQNRVSAWADQSGLGNNATQGTAASQPLYQELDNSGLWVPNSTTGVTQRIGSTLDGISVSMNLPNAVFAPFNGTSKPISILALVEQTQNQAGVNANGLFVSGATATLTGGWRANGGAGQSIEARIIDDSALARTFSSGLAQTLNAPGTIVTIYDGNNFSIWLNGIAAAGNPFSAIVGTLTLSGAAAYFQAHMVKEMAVYTSVLSASDRKRVENGMRARRGLPLL